jgi:alkanesulfonate monooxygenase SsuD/methylene tetrahydromethanopterin reductase-like flavin-dependent oxidoreductase (luciferase family)
VLAPLPPHGRPRQRRSSTSRLIFYAETVDEARALVRYLGKSLADMNERELEREKNPPPANMSQEQADEFADAFNEALRGT